MDKQLGAAVWGAGWVSAEHLRAWANNPHCRVVAMGSRTKASVHKRLAETGLSGVSVYTDLAGLLKHPGVDVVSSCVPPHVQAESAIRAAEAGKHVLVEKPIATTLDQLRRLRDTIRATRVQTCTSFCLRWNPMIQIAKRLVDDGWLGKIIYSRFAYFHELGDWLSSFGWIRTRAQAGSTNLLGGCHAVDTMLFLLGKRAKEVAAYSVRGHREDFEYEPTMAGVVRFGDDTLAHVAASFELPIPYWLPVELMGSAGAIRDGKVWSERLKGQTDWVSIPTIMPDSGDVAHHPFQAQIDHFVDCILTDTESHASVENTVHSHEVVLAMDESAARGGEVVRLPLLD